MNEDGSMPAAAPEPSRPSRLRRFLLRHLPLTVAGCAVVACLALAGLYFWSRSSQCERMVRQWLVAQAEAATGGQVEIASFTWRPLHLEADAGGITIHGLEGPGEQPYAQIANLRVKLSVLGLFSPRVVLRSLDISHPSMHLIVYADGRTNQPRPRRRRRPGKPPMDTLFDLQAGRVTVEQAVFNYDNRAASFDVQNRNAPLNLNAKDVALRMSYVPAAPGSPEHYRIEAGGADLNLLRGARPGKGNKAHGYVQATLDLTRKAAYLRSLRLTSEEGKGQRHSLDITGVLKDFAHPRWQAKARGAVDLGLLGPVTGFPDTTAGIAQVDLTGAGAAGEFRADGNVSVDNGVYIDPNVHATGVQLNAHVHADPKELLITSIVARLREGGQVEGRVALTHWLPPIPGAAEIMAAHERSSRPSGGRKRQAVVLAAPETIPVNGKVTAELENVSLDTVLDIVSQPPFQRLGLGTLLNGRASATWSSGEEQTLEISTKLNMSPPTHPLAGESALTGAIDATYRQSDGAVNLRALTLQTPGSRLEAHGRIGAFPLNSQTSIFIDVASHDLREFDPVLRSLGLHRGGKVGIAAIPVSLGGQAEFNGTWTGSLDDPQLAGQLKATQLTLEMPPAAGVAGGQSRLVRLDSADVSGSYAAKEIAIHHALLVQGASRVAVSGTLDAEPGTNPTFGGDSTLHANLEASRIAVSDLQPFIAAKLPVAGSLDARLRVDGPLHAPAGSGWVQLDGGSIYGEPLERVRVEGSLAHQMLTLGSVVATAPAGGISGRGSYDLASRHFEMSATGAGIDISRIAWLRRKGLAAAGKLTFSLSGSGTPAEPHFDGQAKLASLALSGEPVGGMELTAHTVGGSLIYDAAARMEGAQLTLHGQTALSGNYQTRASAAFSRFNIAALLKLARVEGLTGESSLAGTVSVEGPLAHPAEMRGDVNLRELAVTLAGVHLMSEGGLQATLAGSRINFNPLHVTGEDTDIHAQGSVDLGGARPLNFTARGSVNLKLVETLDPDVSAAGLSTFEVEAHGTLANPGLQGRIDIENGSLALGDMPNSLSQLHGTLVFNQNRLEVKTLTAMTGGGLLSVGGYLAYQRGVFADLTITGKGIRIRYPPGITSQADASLHLAGPQKSLLLQGDVMITGFAVSPNLDIAALAAHASAAAEKITPPDAPSNHIRLEVHVASSPQLNFQNAYAKLAGDLDLRIRGTVANPSLLGRISITEGAATIAGTRYDLDRGDITFTNPVRIEPNIDLSATARVSDYDVTLEVHGAPERMTVNYRSDPPLPEADVISLLALGHTQSQERLYTQQQEQALTNPTTDVLLGGALNATVSSRVQKLFGAGSVKIDPHYLGALGNSTSRITVQEQIGRNVTLTYATDVDTTGQQLLQADIAINRHVSLLVARDESGVFSMVIKTTRRYR